MISLTLLDCMELCWYCLPFFSNNGSPFFKPLPVCFSGLFVALWNSLRPASNNPYKNLCSGRSWHSVQDFPWSACNAYRSWQVAVLLRPWPRALASPVQTHWCDYRGKVCVFAKFFTFCSRVVIVWNFPPLYSSNIVHSGAGLSLFATKDFKKGDLFGHYFGALYLCHRGGFQQFHAFTFASNTNK